MRSTLMMVLLGLATPVFGGTYNTPMVLSAAGTTMSCIVSNVGTTAVTVAVSFLNGSGTTTSPASDTCASGGGTLAPGETCYGALDAAGSLLARCSVDASSSKIRAALMLVRTGDTVLSVPATKK